METSHHCCGSWSGFALIWLFWIRIRTGMRIRIHEHGNWPKLTNKPGLLNLKTGLCTFVNRRYAFLADHLLEVYFSFKNSTFRYFLKSLTRIRIHTDPHWFGYLNPDPHWDKKLDPDPHWNHNTASHPVFLFNTNTGFLVTPDPETVTVSGFLNKKLRRC